MTASVDPPREGGRTGRRPGKPDTRAHILSVAGQVFRRDGFDAASVRGIAREAGVDQALVHRYFGTKRQLYVAAIGMAFDTSQLPGLIAAGGPVGVGGRMIALMTALWDSPAGQGMLGTLREHPELLPSMAAFVHDPVVEAAATMLGVSQREAETRATLIEAQILGLVMARYLARREPLASLGRDEVIRVYGPILQRIITEDIGLRVSRKKSSPPEP